MKKIIVMLFALLTALNFSACDSDSPAQSDKIKVVSTIFPIYD